MHTSLLNFPLKDKKVPDEVRLVWHDLAHCQSVSPTARPHDEEPSFHLSEIDNLENHITPRGFLWKLAGRTRTIRNRPL